MPISLIFVLVAHSSFVQAHQPTPTPTPASSASPTPFVGAYPLPGAGAPPVTLTEPTQDPTPPETAEVAELVAEGDAHFVKRSIGAVNLVAEKHEVDAAIVLYRKALLQAPRDLIVLTKLMRAMHFRGAYTGADLEEKKIIFEEGRKLGQDAVDRLEADAKNAKGRSRIESLRLVKGSAGLYLWTVAHWGEWALAKGKFAAARNGIAGRLRDLSQTVIDIDPYFQDAAGYRTLGRIHSEAPKIPLITGWVSHEKGVQYLRKANQLAPHDPVTLCFLGEAILDHEPEKKAEAMQFLEESGSAPSRPDTELEDARYSDEARDLLKKLKAGS